MRLQKPPKELLLLKKTIKQKKIKEKILIKKIKKN